ncbi:beta family protein [Pseudomonas aeruginosa]|uniref:beta family protein n=3 Tax=Pseudomonas aeruginosa TaxID=287 RepID=UPI0008FB8484|nr:hypothetical protein [Pseudomonas aeruginosa]EKP5711604.1 hypothetical protein [Pseudomonas aeruginosa]ELX9570147.1 hypothetical protein [Pseudomonas aeruginosa]MBX6196151.1 hypothetical protein [Pseudomonas aeruginosa]MDI3907024.1 hypothetical protein [Pseudomonas aeruginosa]MDI4010272.1 hypothetical protein [Pseudomonas aeruginosa]
MEYVASFRVGQNDVKAIINIENARRDHFTPLLNMRGDDDRHLNTFLNDWTAHSFFLDISRAPADIKEQFIKNNDLHNPGQGFQNKRKFFNNVQLTNGNLIPVVSWVDKDHQRDVIQCAITLLSSFNKIAIRVFCSTQPTTTSWQRAKAILDAVSSPQRVYVILDFGITPPSQHSVGSAFHSALMELDDYNPAAICLLSSTFPADKPASNTSRQMPCLDIVWQTAARTLPVNTPIIYGDYAAMNPAATMEYIAGMPVLPFANYYTPVEWWQRRKGGDKEFTNYVDIAKEIRMLPGYHGDAFCWATREIGRIATTGAAYGNNGIWNGFRMNQHVCAMLEHLQTVNTSSALNDDDL